MILNVRRLSSSRSNLADLVDERSQFGSIGVTKVTRALGVRLAHTLSPASWSKHKSLVIFGNQ
jgi:hypothetical protein